MANFYLQASFVIPIPDGLKESVQAALSEPAPSFTDPCSRDEQDDDTRCSLADRVREAGFTHVVDDGEAAFFTEESGDMQAIVKIVQELARRVPGLNSTSPWSAEFACTCSKPRSGGFSGGAVVFDMERSEWTNATQWASDTADRWRSPIEQIRFVPLSSIPNDALSDSFDPEGYGIGDLEHSLVPISEVVDPLRMAPLGLSADMYVNIS